MSTDHQRDPSSKPPGETPPEKPKPALSITQVVGGALAAMTAAALGSRVGVAGTVVGAALASVVAAVASTVYTSSLRRTSKTVSTVWRTRVRPDGHGGTTTVVEETTPDGTSIEPATSAPPTWAEATADPDPAATDVEADQPDDQQRRRRIGWKPVVVTAVLAFVVAAVALTGLELATGRSLSGGGGTTVGQVAEGRDAATPEPSPTPTRRTSASPSATPTAGPTAAPSTTAPTPSASTPTTEPTPTPSAGPTASEEAPTPGASSTPSAPVTPGGPAGTGPAATP